MCEHLIKRYQKKVFNLKVSGLKKPNLFLNWFKVLKIILICIFPINTCQLRNYKKDKVEDP